MKAVTTARISPRDNDLGPISESNCARAAAEAALRRLLYDESDEEGISFRISLFVQLYNIIIILYYNIIIILSI